MAMFHAGGGDYDDLPGRNEDADCRDCRRLIKILEEAHAVMLAVAHRPLLTKIETELPYLKERK